MKTVQITQHDDGRITVGEQTNAGIPPETITPGTPGGEEGQQEVRSIDEALQVARDILSGPSPEEAAEGEAAFEAGYGGIRGPDAESELPA